MALTVVAYPELSPRDYSWIQSIRKERDLLFYPSIAPHFTLVYPAIGLETDSCIQHIRKKCENVKSFKFTLRSAMLYKDFFSDDSHVFLLPDEGTSPLIKLHDQLYTGVLASKLRLDIPFIPSIAIANSSDPLALKKFIDTLNSQNIQIQGKVSVLDVAVYERNHLTTVERIRLR